MNSLHLNTNPEHFIWASGIEDTFVPQTRPNGRALDEYELMGHYDHWREDLNLAKTIGVQALRWGVPWYRVEPQQGVFDWSWTDQVIPYMVEELGITPILDLMHYGCPFWLKQEFANPRYPDAVAAYAAAFAERYQKWVKWYTPLNEPIVNTLMCGRLGLWPPYLRGDKGYARIMVQLVKGIFNTVDAIRAVQPDSIMVHVEASGLRRAGHESLATLVEDDTYQNYLCFDLLTGKVTPDHALFRWLLRNGISAHDLEGFARHPIPLDVMGLNFYPQWSTQQIYLTRGGRIAYRSVEKAGDGFAEMIEAYYRRYNVPVMVTETSAHSSNAERTAWLDASLAAIKSLRSRSIPVIGYTWFPMFTMIDWKYRYGKEPVEKYRLELGLFQLQDGSEGSRWQQTPLVERFCQYVNDPHAAIGPFAEATSMQPINAGIDSVLLNSEATENVDVYSSSIIP